MESDLRQRRHLLHPHRPPPTTAGLTRFRSAPSSFFETLLESCEEFLNRPSSPETERMLTRLISDDDIAGEFPAPGGINSNQLSQFTKNIKSETETLLNKGGNNNNSYGGGGGCGGSASENYYHISSHPPPLPSRKIGNGGSSLIRQSSSPAGLFSDINIENGSYSAGIGGSNCGGTAAFHPPTNRFGSPMNYSSVSSGMASSMAQMMSPIAETGHMRIIASELLVQDNNSTTTVTTESSFSQGNPSQQEDDFTADFSWDDAQSYSPALKRARLREDQSSNFSRSNSSEIQDEEFARPPSMLTHHLSLPNTTAVDKFLELQDTTVPWRIRAKRGCATHPRSIAERVRRTRISERMRRLQHLVPNMDKQTNTSDMLDFAVEHIKDLQKQLKMLSASRASCRCQQ